MVDHMIITMLNHTTRNLEICSAVMRLSGNVKRAAVAGDSSWLKNRRRVLERWQPSVVLCCGKDMAVNRRQRFIAFIPRP